MERTEWLKEMRRKAEQLYDMISPLYWTDYGLYPDPVHREYLGKFLGLLPEHSRLLSAGCGAGRYDGYLLEAGHDVTGTDQSAGMLKLAREHFPQARYMQVGLQEMDFQAEFDGAICMDALEHVCPEDWPVILGRFAQALKPGGVLYFTVDIDDPESWERAFRRALAKGLPVVAGEVADQVDEEMERLLNLGRPLKPEDAPDESVYHFHPTLEQVRRWLGEAGFRLEAEGPGDGYEHFVARKNR
jgi:SAM-dependent methyltransferase